MTSCVSRAETEDVDLELPPRLIDRHVLDGTVGAVARVVDEGVDPPLLGEDAVDAGDHRRVVGDVHRERRDAARLERRHPLDPAGDGIHRPSGRDEMDGDGLADAGRRPRDEGYFAHPDTVCRVAGLADRRHGGGGHRRTFGGGAQQP